MPEKTMDGGAAATARPAKGTRAQAAALTGSAGAELTRSLARGILARLGEAGQPPEVGIGHVNVGNESYLGVLEEEYLKPIAEDGRGSSFKLVQAYFGGGKTHFLYCVRERAWALGFPTAVVGLSPDECPFDDPVRIYSAVAREITYPPRDPAIPPARGIDVVLRTILDDRLAGESRDSVARWIATDFKRTPTDSPACRTAVAGFLEAALEGKSKVEDLLVSYLRGEDVAGSEVRDLGIRETLKRDSAFRFLRGLIQCLQALGAPGLVLAFDEMDRNLSFSPSRRRAIGDNLRQMIDLCGREALPGLLCLYAVPPEFMTKIVPEYVALQQRLEGPGTLSVRSPQAVLIDLENLDVPQQDLLVQIGERILAVFEKANARRLDPSIQRHNLKLLASEVLQTSWEVAHRRAFVKAAVQMLYDQARGGDQKRLKQPETAALASRAGAETPPASAQGSAEAAPAADGFEEF